MAFLEGILVAVLTKLLTYLLDQAMGQAAAAAAQLAEDKRLGVINEANVKAYDEAKDRADRREAALNLLNGTAP